MATQIDPGVLRASGALLATNQALSDLLDRRAVEVTGLDPTTLDLLVRLDQAPDQELRAVDLSRQLLLSPSHVSRRVDRAEAAGLVERRPDPDDRRASRVSITAAGSAAVASFAPALTDVIDAVIREPLTAAEVDTLVDLLERIERAVHTAVDAAAGDTPESGPRP